MGKKEKQKKQLEIKVDLPDQEILNSIGHPNVWTPETEDAWMKELRKVPSGEIYRRFPPMKKPGNVALRGRNYGWGGSNE
jgi:3-isopropylmalate dehydratase small subunit